MRSDVELAFAARGGVLLRRDHPSLARHLDFLLAGGQITSPLPGVLACRELIEAEVPLVEFGAPRHPRSRRGWSVGRRRIPAELVRSTWLPDHSAVTSSTGRCGPARPSGNFAGYPMLNFTWRHLTERPAWVISCVVQALEAPDGRRG